MDWTWVQYTPMQVTTIYHLDRVIVNDADGSVTLVHAVRPPAHGRAKLCIVSATNIPGFGGTQSPGMATKRTSMVTPCLSRATSDML